MRAVSPWSSEMILAISAMELRGWLMASSSRAWKRGSDGTAETPSRSPSMVMAPYSGHIRHLPRNAKTHQFLDGRMSQVIAAKNPPDVFFNLGQSDGINILVDKVLGGLYPIGVLYIGL